MTTTFKFVKQLGYSSIINYINIGENGTVDVNNLNTVLTHMFNNGWKEITVDAIDCVKPSTQIRYIIKDDEGIKFRTGGFFIKFYSQEEDDELTDSYILYSSHLKGVNATAQLSSIYKIYIYEKPKKEPKIKESKIIIQKLKKKIKFKQPTNETKYPVCMKHSDGNVYVVYYGRTEKEKEIFMNTNKYKNALNYGWEFL